MKTVKRIAILALNFTIAAVAAYAIGYYNGSNTPEISDIDRAVLMAMMEN
jgi:hypothetical protein